MHTVRVIIISTFLFVTSMGYAQYSDKQLYEAYLTEDMSLWADYLHTTSWQKANKQEKARVLNYMYGYIPYLNSVNQKDSCLVYYERFMRYLDEYKPNMNEAEYYAYLSGGYAYACMVGKSHMIYGVKSLNAAEKAINLITKSKEPLPLVYYARANVYFYSPKFVGGDKEKALHYFSQAAQLMANDTTFHHHWIYPATQLNIAQCYDKTGHTDQAINLCEHILLLHPTFRYVKYDYLPQLRNN